MTLAAQERLDNVTLLEAADPSGILRQVASAAAQVRESARVAQEADLGEVIAGRPAAGDRGHRHGWLRHRRGCACRRRRPGLPGPGDHRARLPAAGLGGRCRPGDRRLLLGSHRGDAVRRRGGGAPRLPPACGGERGFPARGHGRAGQGPLHPGQAGRHAAVDAVGPVGAARRGRGRLGLLDMPAEAYEAAAAELERVAYLCRPDSEAFVNPAKGLALELSGTLPMIWGTSPLAGVAASRFANQLYENGKYPAMPGVLPEANHNQVVVFDGPFAAEPDGGGLPRPEAGVVPGPHGGLMPGPTTACRAGWAMGRRTTSSSRRCRCGWSCSGTHTNIRRSPAAGRVGEAGGPARHRGERTGRGGRPPAGTAGQPRSADRLRFGLSGGRQRHRSRADRSDSGAEGPDRAGVIGDGWAS